MSRALPQRNSVGHLPVERVDLLCADIAHYERRSIWCHATPCTKFWKEAKWRLADCLSVEKHLPLFSFAVEFNEIQSAAVCNQPSFTWIGCS
jgi:hypothetical protein